MKRNKQIALTTLTGPDGVHRDWGPAWLHPTSAKGVFVRENTNKVRRDGKTVSSQEESVSPIAYPDGRPDGERTTPDASDFYFDQLSAEDLRRLTEARPTIAPCPWCGGRLRHNRLRDAMRSAWEPMLTFGKHKGKRLSAVPADYLQWLVRNSAGVDTDLRDAIEKHLETAK